MESTHLNLSIYDSDILSTSYLYSLGFKFDNTAPEGVYRMKHNRMCDHHISITFDVLPSDKGYFGPTYGFFHRNDEYNRITRKHEFKNTVLTITEFEAIMLDVYGNPRNVKDGLRHNNIKD